jgi:hypothetical protein
MKIISLGCCCETTFVIDRLFGTQPRSPFDWLSIHDPNQVTHILTNNFENFVVEEKQLVPWKAQRNDHPLYFSRIGHYDIHDIHGIDQETLDRRVERFRSDLQSDEKIIFVIKCHYPDLSVRHPYAPNMCITGATDLRDALRNSKGDDNFTLLVVNEDTVPHEHIREENLLMVSITGEVVRGSERGKVVVPCDYSTTTQYLDQWQSIFRDIQVK